VIGQVLVSREASKPPKRAFPAVFTSSKKVSNAFARSVKPRYQILAHPLTGLAAAHRTVASSRLIRCTVPTPTPSAAAILRSPGRFFLLKAVCTAIGFFFDLWAAELLCPLPSPSPTRRGHVLGSSRARIRQTRPAFETWPTRWGSSCRGPADAGTDRCAARGVRTGSQQDLGDSGPVGQPTMP
jgi:hypothetical protein